MEYLLICGDSLEKLKDLDENSVDSIVTDPPYELGFMGKKWDSTGIAFKKELWQEALRVLKPGGHLLAFSGTRTVHRMVCAIEDAGFEIRDMITWNYGSGFPKSLDVSKAIDKLDAKEEKQKRNYKFTEWVRSTGLTASIIDKITNTNMGSHYTTHASQPAIATREYFELLRPYFNCDVPEWVEKLVDERTVESENFKNREVIGTTKTNLTVYQAIGETNTSGEINITAPSTEQAKQWQGWGTALKPSIEPICVARKPLSEKTVAENVLKWGVGGLNIDGCRVGDNGGTKEVGDKLNTIDRTCLNKGLDRKTTIELNQGRWPANFIHDGLDTEWAKFFYCAKASRKDRNEGLDGFEKKQTNLGRQGVGENEVGGISTPQANNHPTVKPTDLMAYLVRLVTPPNGTVLDPFNGSGSTGKACAREGFDYIGIDLSQEYLDISKARIEFERNKKKE